MLVPLFGQAYQSAKRANTSEQFIQSKEATNVAVAWGTTVSTILGSFDLRQSTDTDHHHRLSDPPCRVMVLEP